MTGRMMMSSGQDLLNIFCANMEGMPRLDPE